MKSISVEEARAMDTALAYRMAPAARVEDEIQRQIVAWWDALECRTAHLLHVPNQGKRDRFSAVTLPGMGLRRGVADLCIMLTNRCAWAEVKAPKGRQEADQIAFEEVCSLLNHPYRIIRSVGDFKRLIDDLGIVYLEPFRAKAIRAKAWV